jgi:hypothetical protein
LLVLTGITACSDYEFGTTKDPAPGGSDTGSLPGDGGDDGGDGGDGGSGAATDTVGFEATDSVGTSYVISYDVAAEDFQCVDVYQAIASTAVEPCTGCDFAFDYGYTFLDQSENPDWTYASCGGVERGSEILGWAGEYGGYESVAMYFYPGSEAYDPQWIPFAYATVYTYVDYGYNVATFDFNALSYDDTESYIQGSQNYFYVADYALIEE